MFTQKESRNPEISHDWNLCHSPFNIFDSHPLSLLDGWVEREPAGRGEGEGTKLSPASPTLKTKLTLLQELKL